MSTVVYDRLIEELATGELTELQREIYDLLKNTPEGLTRHEFVLRLYGYIPLNINDNKHDRKIRKAIETLRLRLFPILSTSSRAGYRLDVSREGVLKMLAELKSRRDHIQEQINAAAKFYDIPEYREPEEARQMALI